MTRRYRSYHGDRGYTLTELASVIGIVGIMVGIAIPSWQSLMQRNTQVAAVNEIVTRLSLARSEAIKRGVQAVFCPSADGASCAGAGADFTWWHGGAIIMVGGNVVQRYSSLNGITVKTNTTVPDITFGADGRLAGVGGTFTFCSARAAGDARYVVIQQTGRAGVSSVPGTPPADQPFEMCT